MTQCDGINHLCILHLSLYFPHLSLKVSHFLTHHAANQFFRSSSPRRLTKCRQYCRFRTAYYVSRVFVGLSASGFKPHLARTGIVFANLLNAFPS